MPLHLFMRLWQSVLATVGLAVVDGIFSIVGLKDDGRTELLTLLGLEILVLAVIWWPRRS